MSSAITATTPPPSNARGMWIGDLDKTDPESWEMLSKTVFGKTAIAGPTQSSAESLRGSWTAYSTGQLQLSPSRDAVTAFCLPHHGIGLISGSPQPYLVVPVSVPPFGKPCFQMFASPSTKDWSDTSELSLFGGLSSEAYTVPQAVSSTAVLRDPDAEQRFEDVFRKGADQEFEDGMESDFSRELDVLVEVYGPSSKEVLSRLLEDSSISASVWAEALRWLGRMDHQGSYEARLWVLERALSSPFAVVRDGAALGLASMNDKSAIPYLQRAMNSERVDELRADMNEVLSQLTT